LTEHGSHLVLFGGAEIDNVLGTVGSISVTGTIPAAGGPVIVSEWSADASSAPSEVQQTLVESF